MAYISVVVPVYKAEDCLLELYRRLKIVLETITPNFEIIMVEDCGGDRSWEIITQLAEQDNRIKGFQFSRNFGQHYAITAGLDHCDGDWVVVMDCDLQDLPEEIPNLYKKAQEGYDVVLASRGNRRDVWHKRFFSWVFYRIFNYLSGLDYNGETANFCILSRKVVGNIRLMRERLRFFGGLLKWMGYPSVIVEVEHGNRFAGKSSYNYLKLWNLAVETIIAYSDKPLRMSIKFGFMIAILSFIYGIYIIIRALSYKIPIMGWSSIIVSIYFMGGIILAVLGVLGIYLGKTFDEVKKRPLYLLHKVTKNFQNDR